VQIKSISGKILKEIPKDALWGADLGGANLGGADLRSADLRSANLWGADLGGANLGGANLRNAALPNGMTLPEYIAWLPSGLLTQGGKTIEEISATWENHSWSNCPMHCAFGANSLEQVPKCHRAGAALFVALFDGKHLPKPGAPPPASPSRVLPISSQKD